VFRGKFTVLPGRGPALPTALLSLDC